MSNLKILEKQQQSMPKPELRWKIITVVAEINEVKTKKQIQINELKS